MRVARIALVAATLIGCGGHSAQSTSDASVPDAIGDGAAHGDAGACLVADSDVPCTTLGFSCCNGSCVNEQNDPFNCGGCGTRCTAPGMMCLGGACTASTCMPACSGSQHCCLVNGAGPARPPACYGDPGCPPGCPTCT